MLSKETEFRFHPNCSYVGESSVALCLQLRSQYLRVSDYGIFG